MKIASAWSTHTNPERAAEEAYEKLIQKLPATPHLLFVHSSCEYDNRVILSTLQSLSPGIPLQGGTSCMGIITEEGFHTDNRLGLGILGIHDPDGSYGVGVAEYGQDPVAAVTSALVQALEAADRPGELPGAIVITGCPGFEEISIRSIEAYLGTSVPILGGTSADNDMSGQWEQFGNGLVYSEAISIAALYPIGSVAYCFHSGYEPAGPKGLATRAENRILYEIDDRPAAQVYNEWTEGLISNVLSKGGSLVPAASFTPLGTPVGKIRGIPYFKLSYPVEARPDGALVLFTEALSESEIALMKGTPDSLATRAGRVVAAAINTADFQENEIEGALVLFCTGCMLAVQDRMQETVDGLNATLKVAPFLCSFTLGEQGCFIGGENRHGNLMIATLIFGPAKME